MDQNNKKLLKKAIKGNDQAFTLLFLELQNKLYRIALSRVKNESDTQDVIQNTIIIVYNNLKKLKNLDSFEAWITKILINECNKIYSSNKRVILSEDNILELHSYEDNFDNLVFNDLIKNLSTKEQLILNFKFSK